MKILYLEDDIDLSNTVEEYLVDEGFEVKSLYNGQSVLDELFTNHYDLLLLDVQVPSINGFDILKNLRDAGIAIPAIFTTSYSSIDDMSKGYAVGADDYIKKPFLLKELVLRIKALLKRELKTEENIIKISKNIEFNTLTSELTKDSQVHLLNPKESKLLKLLCSRRNECVTFEEIFQNVWSFDEEHSEMSLRTYIKMLRKYIPKEQIVSIKKIGYKFVQE